jgi:hypothetical protein
VFNAKAVLRFLIFSIFISNVVATFGKGREFIAATSINYQKETMPPNASKSNLEVVYLSG